MKHYFCNDCGLETDYTSVPCKCGKEEWVDSETLWEDWKRMEELLRWRKWPEEKPDDGELVIIFIPENERHDDPLTIYEFCAGDWESVNFYWRPIGPMPG